MRRKADARSGITAASLLAALSLAACGGGGRHAPEAHMDQNADRYEYSYDDGVCHYDYVYSFKSLTDHLDQHGDCRDVPVQRYKPQAAMTPAFPPPAAAAPLAGPAAAMPSVTVGKPVPARPAVRSSSLGTSVGTGVMPSQ